MNSENFTQPSRSGCRPAVLLFLASCAALYFELVVIRYLGSEIRVFAYLKNMPLIASFFGIGLGMILGAPPPRFKRAFPALAAIFFLLIANAWTLHFTHVPMPTSDIWEFSFGRVPVSLSSLLYLVVVLYFLALVVGLFVVLGGTVGEYLRELAPLKAYGINLLGSLTGILLFTALAFLYFPPWVWLLIGFMLLVPFFAANRRALAIFALLIAGVAVSPPRAMWSPYYRITIAPFPHPQEWPEPGAYALSVNYDYFQKLLNLSPEFLAKHPEAEPNRSSLKQYELPYRLMPHAAEVLVVGAGTGNDVAAALRHGAQHVDAVEIDPLILELGRRFHPEHPYASARVSIHNDDARAFFKKTRETYDLIVFGLLDSHTMLSSYTSVRLENNVYTVESLQEAKRLLRPGGTLVLSFAAGRSFVTERLFRMLNVVFGAAPRVYVTGYDMSVTLVEGPAPSPDAVAEYPEISGSLLQASRSAVLASDRWPFLFLEKPRISTSVLLVLIAFILFAAFVSRRTLRLQDVTSRESLHMFFLGAGFLLLETKGITELSLVFGGTWITNTVVIAAFLLMAIAANTIVMFRPVSYPLAYSLLFVFLLVAGFFPYSTLDSLSTLPKVLAAGSLTALPALFSGLIFSRSFQTSANPAQALGMNLLGAVVGGVLENFVMMGGTPVLGILALALYAASPVGLMKPRRIVAPGPATVA